MKPPLSTIFRLTLAAYWLALAVVTHLPPAEIPKTNVSDKVAHLGAYFLLGLLLCLAVRSRSSAVILVLGIVMLYGAVDELTQTLVGRSCELADWCADVAGGALAVVLFDLARRFLRREKSVESHP